jgi:riboflavin synthase alpha subunit
VRRLLPDRHDPAAAGEDGGFTADLMAETLRATALGDLEVGAR